ncbi:MAG: alpha/beta fold hydrolase [SAR324 cluster bacterium]|nr:alpha/beta fold hydrolase [SAR324 cluster bacterium]
MRAKYPDSEGFVERGGVKTHYEVYGEGEHTVFLMPTWSIYHSRVWKGQIPYLSRHFRVITCDGRGNGKSDRPLGVEAHLTRQYVDDVIAVMDATGTETAVVVGSSRGGHFAGMTASLHPERVEGAVLIAPSVSFGPVHEGRESAKVIAELESHEGWDKFNVPYWKENYPDFIEFFVREICSEAHSTKQIEDGIGWALETDGHLIADTMLARIASDDHGEGIYRNIKCPVLVIHGDDDHVIPHGKGAAVAELTGGELITFHGSGHMPHGREPVKTNLVIKDFLDRLWNTRPARFHWVRGRSRQRKALYLSSPIGLGHARRDLAIAQELKALKPDLHIDWLTQEPVTTFLQDTGERVHPASRLLANESAHLEDECGEHDLHCFQALRRMDEILVSNFHVFQEVVEEGHYDLIIADEAWDVDHFWHEHPELKRGALAWFTDFVGFLPFSEGGEWEAYLTADYNEEMIEHVERFPWVRDRAIFVGGPEDIVPDAFGPQLPAIKDWTQKHFDFCGYITGGHPSQWGDPAELRKELGYRPDEKVCIATVGGSGVGAPLLRRILEAWPEVQRKLPELRMVLVAGPRIDPASLGAPKGVEVRAYVPDLHKHLAVCDLAMVQGGLSTTMELAAANRPFLYFPLKNHFEQNFHVHHRLQRYGAGRRMDYDTADPDAIAEAMVAELGRELNYKPVETDGAQRAAKMLADLL